MIGAGECVAIADQHLATPDGAVSAETGTVKDQSGNLFLRGNLVFEGGRGQVGVMMLNADGREAVTFRPFKRILRGKVIRMQVMSDHFRCDPKK